MEKKSKVLSDSRTVMINFDPRVPISEIKMVFEKIGPVVRFNTCLTEDQSIALITFKSAEQARTAIGIKHIKTSITMEDKTIQTDPIEKTPYNQTKAETYPLLWLPVQNAATQEPCTARYNDLANTYNFSQIPYSGSTEETFGSSMPNITGPGSHIAYYEDEVNTRLHCQIPYSGLTKEREVKFLTHFSKFGPLIYHHVLYDKFGQPNSGFVCYRNPNDAGVALLMSDPIYRARPAKPRKMSILDFGKPVYERQLYHTCGMLIERSIYRLHENTCRILQQLQYQVVTTIVGKPVMYEQATKRPKSAEFAALDCTDKKSKLTIELSAIPENTIDLTKDHETTSK